MGDDLRQLAQSGVRSRLHGGEVENATPYALQHSFAPLLLHEGRLVIYVVRQLGHDAGLTLTTHGHVIDELDDEPRLPAEDASRAAREPMRRPARVSDSSKPEPRAVARNPG
jgi:hypothetical protein